MRSVVLEERWFIRTTREAGEGLSSRGRPVDLVLAAPLLNGEPTGRARNVETGRCGAAMRGAVSIKTPLYSPFAFVTLGLVTTISPPNPLFCTRAPLRTGGMTEGKAVL